MSEAPTKSVPQTTQVRFGGVGGQGIVLAGRLLGHAASIFDGKEAVSTQSYGPEARGGASRADVVISDEPVDYPFVADADILAVFFQEAYARYRPRLKPGGLLLVDSGLVQPAEDDEHFHAIPATKIAEELGSRMAANIVMLGYLIGATGVVSRDAMEKSIRATVKQRLIELDMKALDAGMRLAEENAAA